MTYKVYTDNILENATFGIDENIDANETIEVNLRDLVFVAQTLQEFVRYFHNRNHYPTLDDLHKYLGTHQSNGAYHLLSEAKYEVMQRMLPSSIHELYDEGVFDAPESPSYFKPSGS